MLEEIGQTPLWTVDGLRVKLECSNPAGSVKDRIARFILEQARHRGELREGDAIVEATSGNTGIAMAMVGREMGHRVVIFMPEHMSVERRQMMESLGAEVRLTPRDGGFEEPIARRDAYRSRDGYYVPDQFANPDNARCHETWTGRELIDQLAEEGSSIDAFVAGVGTGGTLMGVGRALRRAFPAVRVVAVEPVESAVMSGGPPGEHGIQGIGDGFIPELVDMSAIDEVECVSTADALAECARIRQESGFCVGASSGANTVAARRLQERGMRVATVWADCSDRYESVGLQAPSSPEVTCPLKGCCAARGREFLDGVPATRL